MVNPGGDGCWVIRVALRGEIRGDIEMGLADIDTDIG